ncbi:CDP-glycerol glycerophosphotransferase family protein, partial [Streptococcus pneumoniae]
APTWRSGTKQYETLDIKKLTQAVDKKFGKKCIVLFRSHLYGNQSYDDVVDVSQYSDMQELLLLSDILITDYSSSMWDFSLSFKPCFLYTPDLKDYL